MRALASADGFDIPNAGVVLDTQVDVLGDTETEVAGLGEVALAELVLLDLEATLEDLLGLGAADGDMDGDLLVTADTEGTDGVAGLGVNWSLTGKLLEHLCCTSQTITTLADRDVEHQFLDAELPHGVLGLVRLQEEQIVSDNVNMTRELATRRTILAVLVSIGGVGK